MMRVMQGIKVGAYFARPDNNVHAGRRGDRSMENNESGCYDEFISE